MVTYLDNKVSVVVQFLGNMIMEMRGAVEITRTTETPLDLFRIDLQYS